MSSSQELYVSALDAIAELRRTGSDLEPMLDYWAAILRAKQEVESSFHPDMGSLDAEQCSRRAAEERPALEPEEIDLDGELFDDLFNRLSGISAEHAVGKDVAATEWPSAPSGDVEWHEKVVRGLLEKREALDELVDGAGVTREVFAFLAGQALTPFLEAYAERARELIDDAKWLREVCPVCGAPRSWPSWRGRQARGPFSVTCAGLNGPTRGSAAPSAARRTKRS